MFTHSSKSSECATLHVSLDIKFFARPDRTLFGRVSNVMLDCQERTVLRLDCGGGGNFMLAHIQLEQKQTSRERTIAESNQPI